MTVPAVPDLLGDATRRLTAAGVGSPRVDAELLLADALGASRSRLPAIDAVPPAAAARFEVMLARRESREPLQHIVGTAPFRHIEVAVGDGVFVPRPETELLVDAVLPHLRTLAEPRVVDLCAGSGALGLAIADEVPAARVVAVEFAMGAQRWLARNTAGTGVRMLAADVTDPELLRPLYGRADVVVCNPPYVPTTTDVQAEVRADPTEAVFAGRHGLDLLPTVILRAGQLLVPGGILALEHDETHADDVVAMADASGEWIDVADHCDLSGRPRYLTARRAASSAETVSSGD